MRTHTSALETQLLAWLAVHFKWKVLPHSHITWNLFTYKTAIQMISVVMRINKGHTLSWVAQAGNGNGNVNCIETCSRALVNIWIIKTVFCSYNSIWNALVTLYANCGIINNVLQLFDIMPKRDESLWNAIVGGCSHNGLAEEALKFFSQMLHAGFKPSKITFTVVLCATEWAPIE